MALTLFFTLLLFRPKWQYEDDYCIKLKKLIPQSVYPRILDLVDMSVFDYLIGNADRHSMELYGSENESMIAMIDNAKRYGVMKNFPASCHLYLNYLEKCVHVSFIYRA